MKTCTQCGKQFPDHLNACPDDGAALVYGGGSGPPSSTPAIVSLVLGVLSLVCGLLLGLPAVICGHIALSRSKKQPEQYGGAGLAIGGLVTGYIGVLLGIVALVAILGGLFLPAFAKARQKAQQINCVNNLKQVGLAVRIWSGDHNGTLPQSFMDMTNELGNPAILICPADPHHTRPPQGAPNVWRANNVTYEFLTPGVAADTVKGQVIIRCPIHGNEVMDDGSVHMGNLRR